MYRRIKAQFESEYHVPIRIRLSFFTRHPTLVWFIITMSIIFITFFAVAVVMAFEEFFATLGLLASLELLGLIIILIIVLFAVFNKWILLRIARFAPEEAVELLKPLKSEIVDISVDNRLVTVRLDHPSARRLDIFCVYQGTRNPRVRFYIDLYSTKPIDKARFEAGIKELKLQRWKFFNIRLREDGRRLAYSGVSGSGEGYSLSQVLPKKLELASS